MHPTLARRLTHLILILSMLLPGLAPTPTRAASLYQAGDGTPTPSLTPEASETPEPISTSEVITPTQAIPTATATLTPTLEIPTATPTLTPTVEIPTATLPAASPTITATITPTPTLPVDPSSTPAASDPEALAALSLNLDANRYQATPGGLLNLYWQAADWQAGMRGLSLELSAPPGVVSDDALLDPRSGAYRLPVDATNGQLQWQIPADLPGPYTSTASLTLDGETIISKTLTLQETGLTRLPAEGGTATGLDGSVRITFPAGAADPDPDRGSGALRWRLQRCLAQPRLVRRHRRPGIRRLRQSLPPDRTAGVE